MKTLLILFCALLLALPVIAQEPAAKAPAAEDETAAKVLPAAESATQVVEALHDALIKCMKDANSLGFKGRYKLIAPVVDETFDLPFMARTSIGKTWQGLDEAQRKRWVGLSKRLSASNYASNFNGFSGESFETLGVDAAAHGTLVVRTELVQPADKNIKLDYRLRKVAGQWRIIDVQLDGKVSEITVRRADYRSVIQRKGFDQLETDLNAKIINLSTG